MRKALPASLLLASCLVALTEYLPSHAGIFLQWVETLGSKPWSAFYDSQTSMQATPGWLLWLGLLGRIGVTGATMPGGISPLFLMKVPAILGVLASYLLVATKAQSWNGSRDQTASANWSWPIVLLALSPALIYNAVTRGIYASLTVLCGTAAIHWILQKKNGRAAACFAALVALQPTAVLLLPAFVLVGAADRRRAISRVLPSLGLGLLAAAGTFVPFWRDRWSDFGEFYGRILVAPSGLGGEFNLPRVLGAEFARVAEATLGIGAVGVLGVLLLLGLSGWCLARHSRTPERYREEVGLCAGVVLALATASFLPGAPAMTSALALPFLYFVSLRGQSLYRAFLVLTATLLVDQVFAHVYEPFLPAWHHYREPFETWRTPATTLSAVAKLFIIGSVMNRMRNLGAGAAEALAMPGMPPNVPFRPTVAEAGNWVCQTVARAPTPFALTWRDLAFLTVILSASAAMNFVNLGHRRLPETGVIASQTLRLEFPGQRPIAGMWMVKDHHPAMLQLRCESSPVWQGASFGTTDSYEWAFRAIMPACKPPLEVRLQVAGGKVYELLFVDVDGNVLKQGRLCPLPDGRCLAFAESPLFDESEGIEGPPSRQDGAIYDEIFNIETGMKSLRFPEESVLTTAHPFLGRALISLSMRWFGPSPWSWRLPGALAGALIPLLLFLLGRELFGDRRVAVWAAFLGLVDCARVALSRVATVDSQLAVWLLVGYICLFRFMRLSLGEAREGSHAGRGAFRAPAMFLGLSVGFGAGTATKWIGAFAFPAVALCLLGVVLAKNHGASLRSRLFKRVAAAATVLAGVPAAIYLVAYWPFLAAGSGWEKLRGVLSHQAMIFSIHTEIKALAFDAYQSPFLFWPLVERPVGIFARYGLPSHLYAANFIVANPVLWWAILPAFAVTLANAKLRREPGSLFLALAFFAQWLPWAAISRRVYLYHFFSASVFGLVAVARLLARPEGRLRHWRLPFACLAVAVFLLFWPMVSGQTVPAAYTSWVQWFDGWFRLYDPFSRMAPLAPPG